MNNAYAMKYWSWMAAFSISILFWGQVVWTALR
ncbi:small membrane protein YmiC [Enterobacter sp. Bisph1]|nr:small membrane protein YmiC [Enterobacter sp. Bisph1]